MTASLPGNILGNTTIRNSFHIIVTHFTYLLLVYILYGIPSLLVTLRIVRTILSPKFRSFFRKPFFFLFTNNCIVGMIFFMVDFFTIRVPASGLITGWLTTLPPGRYITAIYALEFYLLYITLYSVTFLSITRAIIICLPMEGTKVIKRCLTFFFLTIYLLPVLTTWFLYPATAYIRIAPQIPHLGYGATFDYEKSFPHVGISLFFSHFHVLVTLTFPADLLAHRSEDIAIRCISIIVLPALLRRQLGVYTTTVSTRFALILANMGSVLHTSGIQKKHHKFYTGQCRRLQFSNFKTKIFERRISCRPMKHEDSVIIMV
ncbi:hypothetical protein OSTOST_04819 [Ostertagia ostertagi]